MSTELNEEVIVNPVDGSELAAEQNNAESQETEVQSEEEVQKAKNQAAWNKTYGEKKQLERDLNAERAKTAAFEAQKLEAQRLSVSNIPDMPSDPYDENYQEDLAKWQTAVREKAAFDANQNILVQNQQAQQQQAQYAQQQETFKTQQNFLDNAKEQGVNDQEMSGLLNTISNYGGVGVENSAFIMQDQDSAVIVKYLAANPQEIATMQQMNGYSLANHINQNIRAKAQALKPKTSSTPPPSTDVHGSGVDPEGGKYPHLKGTIYS